MESGEKTVWLVYDGECPICKPAANALKIKRAFGELKLADKRTSNDPIIAELKEQGINLENGMVIKMNGQYFQGADALHLTALLSSSPDFMNKLTVLLFRSKTRTKLLYPSLKAARNILIKLKGIPPIE